MASDSTKSAPEPEPEAPARLDETIPGGKYIVRGVVVDAHGKPLEDQSDAPAPKAPPASPKPLTPPSPPAK